ncbi:MAG: FtsW/RodA/SpoVE family cell cycle protein [Chlamydiia bacterium]
MYNRRDVRPPLLLSAAVAVLIVWGLLTVFNTSSAEVIDRLQMRSTHAALFKQTLFAGVGVLLCLTCWRRGIDLLLRRPWWLWGVTVALLVCCWVPGIGMAANGAHRWLRLGSISLQPSEIAKIALPFLMVAWCRASAIQNWRSFLLCMAPIIVPIFLVLLEPDNGTTLIMLFEVTLLLFLLRVPAKYWAMPMAVVCLVGAALAWQMPHVHRRLEVYLNPELDLRGKGHQPYQARIAVGSGGLYGRGLGQGLQKLEYLPEAQNDYIAAIVAEETGFLGMLSLIACYCCILLSGAWIGLRQLRPELRALAVSLSCVLVVQACLNLGVVSGVFPSTGINLPLFSQGGSSLLCNLALVGWLLHIAVPIQRPSSASIEHSLKARRGSLSGFSRIHWREKPNTLA